MKDAPPVLSTSVPPIPKPMPKEPFLSDPLYHKRNRTRRCTGTEQIKQAFPDAVAFTTILEKKYYQRVSEKWQIGKLY